MDKSPKAEITVSSYEYYEEEEGEEEEDEIE